MQPWQGPIVPPMISNPRTLHEKRVLSPIEQNWYDGIPFFSKTKVDGPLLDPINSMPTLEGLGHFISRTAEIRAIQETQADGLELATIRDQLAANGVRVLSSSFDDDDGDEWDRLGARHQPDPDAEYRSSTEYSTLTRNIEWEKYFLACGLPMRSTVAHDFDETFIGVAPDPEHRMKFTAELLAAQAARLKESGWRDGRTPHELEHDRHIARYRKTIGSGKGTYDPSPQPSHDTHWYEWANEDHEEEATKDVGEVELCFHAEDTPYEPREEDLWPYSQIELLHILHAGLPLTDAEQRWADSQGLRLPAPSKQRLLTVFTNEQGEGRNAEEAKVLSA